MKQITGAELFVKALKEENVTTQFLAIDHKKADDNFRRIGNHGLWFSRGYGAKGIRVTSPEDIGAAFETAKQNTKTPTVIEFIIDREINALPIVPLGNALSDMILESEGNRE